MPSLSLAELFCVSGNEITDKRTEKCDKFVCSYVQCIALSCVLVKLVIY